LNRHACLAGRSLLSCRAVLGLAMLLGMGTAVAQGHGGGSGHGGPPGGGEMGGHHGGFGGEDGGFGNIGSSHTIPGSGSGHGEPSSSGTAASPHFSVTSRWWDDKKVVKKLSLRPDQKQRMDGIFNSNRAALTSSYQTFQKEQGRLDAILASDHPDEQTIFALIERTSQARADLEKAYAHLSFQIRKELDAGQLTKLDSQQ
jgi:Spy/CpxP family protein refolding chaperone